MRALRWAQNSLCAGCGKHMPSKYRLKRYDPRYPTFDHVELCSDGGSRTLGNGLLKHFECNQRRGARKASGCDRIWLDVVVARLASRPSSFKSMFAGGLRNPAR